MARTPTHGDVPHLRGGSGGEADARFAGGAGEFAPLARTTLRDYVLEWIDR